MVGAKNKWEKLGRLLAPDASVPWLKTHVGASCAVPTPHPNRYDLFVTGRDETNRSYIGRLQIEIGATVKALPCEKAPVLALGALGTFDDSGVSYPCVVTHERKRYLFYLGWMRTVTTPFQNHIGLAIDEGSGKFERFSPAPLIERNHDDPFGNGSMSVLVEKGKWRMWYTCYLEWGKSPSEPKHKYLIKYAESEDGLHWHRPNRICIPFRHAWEFSIARPTVIFHGGQYHMWYCTRGEHFQLGYAHSRDGIAWERRDDLLGIAKSSSGWDSQSQCFPYVFKHQNHLYLLYCGNDYGRDGLGVARLELEDAR